ncbi:hypothetical protein D3C72_1129850 [compost metagenome]
MQEGQHALSFFRFAIHILLQIVIGDALEHRFRTLRILPRQAEGHDATFLAARRDIENIAQIVHRFLARHVNHGEGGARLRFKLAHVDRPTALLQRLPHNAAEQGFAVMTQAVMLRIIDGQGQFLALHHRRHLHGRNTQYRRHFATQASDALAEQREIVRADAHRQAEVVDGFANYVT